MIACTDCEQEAALTDSVCAECGGFLAGSAEPSLGVFSQNLFLDTIEPRQVIDLNAGGDSQAEVASSQDDEPQVQIESSQDADPDANASPILGGSDGSSDTLVAPTEPIAQPVPADQPSIDQSVEQIEDVAVQPQMSLWPWAQRVLTVVGYVMFVLAVAIAVNRILSSL